MSLLPLQPGVRRSPDAGSVSGVQPTKAQAEKTLRRDGFSCRFCGFTSDKFQRVISYHDGQHDHGFVTCCTLCEQVVSMERSGITGSALLIWLPEMTQVELNHLVRAIYVTRAAKSPLAETATKALDALTARRAEAKKRLGSDDPLLLATVMIETLSNDDYKSATHKLDGIRYLPSDKQLARGPQGDVNQFPAMIEHWRKTLAPYQKLV